MAIYTGKGDRGTTKLFNTTSGERISKDELVFEVLGSLDELNTFLGVCRAYISDNEKVPSNKILKKMQNHLFSLQAQIAGASVSLAKDSVIEMEKNIWRIEKEIPPITGFIVSGEGIQAAAFLDFGRTLCRRTERLIIKYAGSLSSKRKTEINEILPFINRLSSLLFALARLENHLAGVEENQPNYDRI